jgi:hypothetical protein
VAHGRLIPIRLCGPLSFHIGSYPDTKERCVPAPLPVHFWPGSRLDQAD